MNSILSLDFFGYRFLSPYWLWLLWLVPAFVWWLFYVDASKKGEVKFSGTERDQKSLELFWVKSIRKALFFSSGMILVLLIIAIARPYRWKSEEVFNHQYKYGIDIVLAMDISASMLARDFEPNRLEVSKKVAKDFIDGRFGDRIGLVVYEGEAFTACPSTLDYEVVKEQIDRLQPGELEGGTAIGTGLGTAVTRLRNPSIKSKVIILLTDGSDNSGNISPETAAELAKAKNIRVYTIGVGSVGLAPTPVMTPFGVQFENMPVDIDENTLKSIAATTGGRYFRAKDEYSLRNIYSEINQLEKTKIKSRNYEPEPPSQPTFFILLALLLLMSMLIVQRLILKTHE